MVTIISLIKLFSLASCGAKQTNTTTLYTPSTIPSEDITPTTDIKEEDNMKLLELKISDTIVTIVWEVNTSVTAYSKDSKY